MAPRETPMGRSRAWIALALVAAAALAWGFWATLDRFLDAGEAFAGAARAFARVDVTQRFISSLPSVRGAARLELATAETVETLTRSDDRRALWDLVPLGSTTVEVRVPVTWRWHLPLDEPWRAVLDAGVLTVEAPALRPSLPPAIHTDGIERRIEEDWLRFDGAEQLARLERELTPLLAARARDPRHLELGRAAARDALADLALRFASGAFPDSPPRAVVVRFAGEPAVPAAAARN